ncbi:MAG: peptidoglycan-binding protein [Spirulinaceae cyanobacterium RM2_2_10]|nr:peptidoglycan-binding protein [Spirulinaceae cyanobacterium SM2_1_0]NJO20628.1 peptidoglycan-binding protein [Spirulinaceae cyanobacterium RM2_2_10]
MEALGYTHSQVSYEVTMGIEYDLSALKFNWRAIPNSAWLSLLAAGVLCAAVSIPKPALAFSVNTPSGACLNARFGPSTDFGVYSCVADGATLVAPSGRTAGNWIELETGRWVYGPFTSNSPGGDGTGGRVVRVATPSGSCLNARSGPSTSSSVLMCVANGATLKPVVASQGDWLQLSSGRWVYGPFTTAIGTGGRPPIVSESFPLRRGMQGESVSTLQRKLISLDYNVGTAGDDGIFGAGTENAVRRFQDTNGLVVDGIVGTATKDAMGLTLPGEGV